MRKVNRKQMQTIVQNLSTSTKVSLPPSTCKAMLCAAATCTRLHDRPVIAVAEDDIHDARREEEREVRAECRQQP